MSDQSALGSRFRGLPRGVRAAVGAASVLLGGLIIFRPTTSLGVLAVLFGVGLILNGILTFTSSDGGRRPLPRTVLAAALVAAGVLVLAWPGLTVRALALIVGIGLVLNGVLRATRALDRSVTLDQRIAAALLGAAGIIFGVLALTWPDITLLIAGVVFGAWLIINGVVEILRAIRAPRPRNTNRGTVPVWRRWIRTIGAAMALVLALGAIGISSSLREGTPVADDFYAPPRSVPAEPGQLIRAEPFERTIPDNARAWRTLYTTTNADDTAAVASGLVIVPRDGAGQWPVIDWNHGTTGFDQGCAPSILAEVLETGAFMLLPDVIEEGWAIVAPDYIGLGTAGPHPYLIGEPTGRASLDAVRAARQLTDADLSDQTVVWGHSQGGGAALWTGAIADTYAPDVNLSGVAALAPASNLPGMIENLQKITGGSIFASFAFAAYSATYPDVTYREYIRPGAEVTVRQLANRCLAAPGIVPSLVDIIGTSNDPRIFAKDPTTGPFGDRLAENIPPATVTAPLLLAQGTADSIVVPSAQHDYVVQTCAAGENVDYRTYAGRDHVPLVEPDSPLIPELLQWTRDRFAGVTSPTGCLQTAK